MIDKKVRLNKKENKALRKEAQKRTKEEGRKVYEVDIIRGLINKYLMK